MKALRGGNRRERLSMKVVGAGDGAGNFQFGEAAGAYVDHSVLLLQRPLGHQERRAMQERAILLKEIGCDYHVGDSRLVLHRDEEEALGRTGTLTHDHVTRDFHPRPVWRAGKIGSAKNDASVETRTDMGPKTSTD